MTNEEREKHIRIANMLIGAINDLIRPILMYQIEKDVTKEALENYIKMLEQQPCEDCISRADVINAIESEDKLSFMGAFCSHDCAMGFIETIKELPSVTPKAESCDDIWHTTYPTVRIGNEEIQYKKIAYDLPFVTPQQTRWIPVSERLPENQDCYLVTTKWKGSWSGDVYIETNMAVYRERPKEWDCKDVIAWMPLPEPYQSND